MAFQLTSSTFRNGEAIPARYTCDGQDISPPLEWQDAPEQTRSFALICDDPDAPVGTWVHWVAYNLPASVKSLPEGVTAANPAAGQQGQNSWGQSGYGGPCPPGGTHRYFFKLYALDIQLTLKAGAGKHQVLKAAEGHILAQAELMGKYSR